MIQRTGKIYRARALDGELIEGELIWLGKTPTIKGWNYKDIQSEGAHAFGEYEVEPDSLEPVDDVDLATMEKINEATYSTTIAGKIWKKILAENDKT